VEAVEPPNKRVYVRMVPSLLFFLLLKQKIFVTQNSNSMGKINFSSKYWNLAGIFLGAIILLRSFYLMDFAQETNDSWLLFRRLMWIIIAVVFIVSNTIWFRRKNRLDSDQQLKSSDK
jgi:tetrahydromethanopterin S-methyltransferase subunit E